MNTAQPDASAQPAPGLPAAKRPPVGRYLFGLYAFLILLSGGLLVLVLTYMRMQTLASGERLSRSFAHVIEEQTTRTLQATDQGLQLATDGLTQLAASGGLTPESAKRVLADQVQPLPFLRAMWVIDAQGRIVFESDSGNIGVDLSDRDYFLRYSSHPDTGFFIGAPVVSRISGTWQVSVARPWRSASGALKGIVVAALEPRYFGQLWRTVDLGQDSSVALLRRDGLMMMRSPLVEASIGKSFSENPLFTERLPTHTNGHYQTASAVDGQTRLYAYRTLSAQPELVVLVGLSQEVCWRAGATWAFWG